MSARAFDFFFLPKATMVRLIPLLDFFHEVSVLKRFESVSIGTIFVLNGDDKLLMNSSALKRNVNNR